MIKGADRKWDEPKILEVFSQVVFAVDYLHAKGIYHRDIKPANIFFDKNRTVKVGDLGIAKENGQGSTTYTGLKGTETYMSPELWDYEKFTEKADVWALGVVLYEMCEHCKPFETVS